MQPWPRNLLKARWYAQRALRRLGVTGVIALGLVVFCVMVYASWIRPSGEELARVRRQLAGVEAQARSGPAARVLMPEEQLRRFEAKLPPKSGIPDAIGSVARIAQAAGVSVEQVDYRPYSEAGQAVMRYEMNFQVTDAYPKIKEFVGKLLAEMPYLAVESLALQRQKVGDPKVEAQIRLSLFFRNVDK